MLFSSKGVEPDPPLSPLSRNPLRIALALIAASLLVAGASTVLFIGYRVSRQLFKPKLPIAVTYRPAFNGSSLVVQFHNVSPRYLTIDATFENGTLHQQYRAAIAVGPYQTVEYGWMEGWAFSSGERITLRNEEYRTVTATVP